MHIDGLATLHHLPVVGVEVGDDGEVFGRILIAAGLQGDGACLVVLHREELVAELAGKDGIAVDVLERDVHLQHVAVAAVELEAQNLGCSGDGGHIGGTGDDNVGHHVGRLVVGLTLKLIGAGRGITLGSGEGVGLGVVGHGGTVEHNLHVDAPSVEVAQEVLREGDRAVVIHRALDPSVGDPLAQALNVDIVAVKAHHHVGLVLLGIFLAKLQVGGRECVGVGLETLGRSDHDLLVLIDVVPVDVAVVGLATAGVDAAHTHLLHTLAQAVDNSQLAVSHKVDVVAEVIGDGGLVFVEAIEVGCEDVLLGAVATVDKELVAQLVGEQRVAVDIQGGDAQHNEAKVVVGIILIVAECGLGRSGGNVLNGRELDIAVDVIPAHFLV